MNAAFSARLRHHSLTCFSRTIAFKPSSNFAASVLFASQPQASRILDLNLISLTLAKPFTTTQAFSSVVSIMNGTTNAARGKRKQYPEEEADRPPKQHRAINGKESVEDNTPDTSSIQEDEMDLDMDETRAVPGLADTAEWQAAIEKVVRNVVSIRFCQTCAFDTDPALTSEATGFVVDAERG
jgi:hypothetical protein